MEAFEHFVSVALQAEAFVVSSGVKFPVRRRVKKEERVEYQTHGYEVDLVAARADRLVLATVKSFFGSRGVQAREVTGEGGETGRYRLLNEPEIRDGVLEAAAKRYGYRVEQIRVRLYVGRFAADADETAIREWCGDRHVGGGPIEVVSIHEVIGKVRTVATGKMYINDPVIMTLKVLSAAALLDLTSAVSPPADEALKEIEGPTDDES